MKYIISSIIMLMISITSYASSNFTFPFNHVEVDPNKEYSTELVGPGLMRLDAPYTITCQLNNPSNESLAVYFTGDFFNGDPSQKLNGKVVKNIFKLNPGVNNFVLLHATAYSYNNRMVFANYDNDNSFIIERCTGSLE